MLQISQNCVRYHGALAPLAAAARALAKDAPTPCVLHMDHAEDVALIHEALRLGFTSVMYDGSALPVARNRATTAELVRVCRDHGVSSVSYTHLDVYKRQIHTHPANHAGYYPGAEQMSLKLLIDADTCLLYTSRCV